MEALSKRRDVISNSLLTRSGTTPVPQALFR